MGRPKGSTNKKAENESKAKESVKKEEVKKDTKTKLEEEKGMAKKNIADNVEAKSKKEVDVVESISEKISSNLENAKKTGVQKYVRKNFDDEDLIPVASFVSGKTNLKNTEKPYDFYQWEKFGDIEMVRFGTLNQLKRKRSQAFEKMLYVLDTDVVKELGLELTYKKIGKIEDIIQVLDGSLDEAVIYIDKASKEIKEVLRQILYNKLERNEEMSFKKVKVLAEKLEMELNLDI